MMKFLKNKDIKEHVSVVLAGNPNVGKSTVFNALTGGNQHTGNWAGKTVELCEGKFESKKRLYTVRDLPGAYSLNTGSKEEEVAEEFIATGEGDITVVICDATCPSRGMYLAMQIMNLRKNVIVVFNLIDEAEKKGIKINAEEAERILGIPVVLTSARDKHGLRDLVDRMDSIEIDRDNEPTIFTCSDTNYKENNSAKSEEVSPRVELLREKSNLKDKLNSTISLDSNTPTKVLSDTIKQGDKTAEETENSKEVEKSEDIKNPKKTLHRDDISIEKPKETLPHDDISAEKLEEVPPRVDLSKENSKKDKSLIKSDNEIPKIEFDSVIEWGLCEVEDTLKNYIKKCNKYLRYIATRLLTDDEIFDTYMGRLGILGDGADVVRKIISYVRERLSEQGFDLIAIADSVSKTVIDFIDAVCDKIVEGCTDERRGVCLFDKILTSKYTAFPMMLLMLLGIIYLTVTFANYPSQMLSDAFAYLGIKLRFALIYINCNEYLISIVCDGVYAVLAEVVSVMLPPMAIFFPLFTILEDAGVLPRIAYNLDLPFSKVGACGKQALTMCMGLGCNATGVVGCRIIDSPRERNLAVITNSLVPCNGRFPTIILLGSIFFTFGVTSLTPLISALTLVFAIVVGVLATYLATFVLSKTVFRGTTSFFTLEMPPYRRPKALTVLVRSFFDRTLHILWRAVVVAIPAGFIIWFLANITVGDGTLLMHLVEFLNPIGKIMGIDGTMLLAFILGSPANEIVMPIAVLGYLGGGFTEALECGNIAEVLLSAGWTAKTAICCVIFSLLHWPCSTTVLTVYKETKSLKTTVLSVLTPTVMGITLCVIINLIFMIFA